MPELAVWAILLLPLAAAGLNGLGVRPSLGSASRVAGALTIAAIGGSLLLSLWALAVVWGAEGHAIPLPLREVVTVGNLHLRIGLLMNGLTAVMLVVVTGVSFLVQVYSHGYMKDDPSYTRYYTYMALFTASMLTLVLANNLIMLYVGWEMVGLCSYLLIGFWYQRPAAAAAAKKAFIVTRFGDFFFLVAILGIFFVWPDGQTITYAISDPANSQSRDLYGAVGPILGGTALTLIALGLFAGAAGKSAQFPLHVWLPDAMEGPTPVSALIHAATMVAAGVFLVARFLPFFTAEDAEGARTVVALIGAFTAVFAATMGLVMNDIKRVLAYSTVSQLGYMMMALGMGAMGAAMFHLFNHAFFKALLFLGSGSVNHATGTFDMRQMGGLRKAMPWTYLTFLIGALSLAGVPPLAGFWSKDEVLGAAWLHQGAVGAIVFGAGLLGAFLTAFYIFRVVYLTFHGENRAAAHHGAGQDGHASAEHLHESPMVMVAPMAILAVFAVGSWVVNAPGIHAFSDLLDAEAESIQPLVMVLSVVAASLGIGLATTIYLTRSIRVEAVGKRFGPLYALVSRKYYMDDLYEGVLVRRSMYRGVWAALAWFDARVVDGMVDLVGWIGRHLGRGVARLQSGQMQTYAAVLSLGAVVIFAAYIVWGV